MATEIRTPETTRKRPINRLQTVYALRNWVDDWYKKGVTASAAGKPVAWCMLGAPKAILNVLDVECSFTENFGTACAASGAATGFVERSEAEGFSNTLCSYAQNSFGYSARMMLDLGGQVPPEAPKGGMPIPDLLVGVSGGTCDARYKWYQALSRYFDCPIWITDQISAPTGKEAFDKEIYENGVRYQYDQLKDFVAFAEKLFKKKLDYTLLERLDAELTAQDKYQSLWYEATEELRKATPCPMNARDHYTAMNASMYGGSDVENVAKLYHDLRDEVKYRVDNKISGINYPEKYRVGFQGPAPWAYLNFYDRLAEKGWNFPRQGYNAPRHVDVSWVKDPIEKMVRRGRRPMEDRLREDFPDAKEAAGVKEEIIRKGYSDKWEALEVRDYQLDGFIIHAPTTCRLFACTANIAQYRMMKEFKVPSMLIVADMADPRQFDLEDFLKKCEAFEESMDYYKEVRRKEGLPW